MTGSAMGTFKLASHELQYKLDTTYPPPPNLESTQRKYYIINLQKKTVHKLIWGYL